MATSPLTLALPADLIPRKPGAKGIAEAFVRIWSMLGLAVSGPVSFLTAAAFQMDWRTKPKSYSVPENDDSVRLTGFKPDGMV